MVEAIVRPAGPYMLSLSARHAGDATRTFRDGVFSATLEVDGRLERVFARQSPDGRVHVAGGQSRGRGAAALLPRGRRRPLGVPPPLSRRPAPRPLDEPSGRAAARARRDRCPGAAAGVLRPADHVAGGAADRAADHSRGDARTRSLSRAADRSRRSARWRRPSCAAWVFTPAAVPRSSASAARSTSSGCATCHPETSRPACSASAASARGRSESSRSRASAAGITGSSATWAS